MQEELTRICGEIVRSAAPELVIMYAVKHTPSADRIKEASLCVVVNGNPKEAECMLYRVLDTEFPCNLLVYRKDDWDKLASDPTSYAASILSKGVVLYGKA